MYVYYTYIYIYCMCTKIYILSMNVYYGIEESTKSLPSHLDSNPATKKSWENQPTKKVYQDILAGGRPTPLKNMSSSVRIITN